MVFRQAVMGKSFFYPCGPAPYACVINFLLFSFFGRHHANLQDVH